MVSGSHDLQDYTRILKFYDNVIFKMVKDFLPARSSVSSGIIVRPHALERNKIKQVEPTVIQLENTGSISVGYYSGSHGGSFTYSVDDYGDTSYSSSIMTQYGPVLKNDHSQQEAKFDGELSGSILKVTDRELPPNNPFKYSDPNSVKYKVTTVELSTCSIGFLTPEYDSITCNPTPTPTPTITVTPTPTPTNNVITSTPTPTPTSTPTPIHYQLSSCLDFSTFYSTSYPSGTFSSGDIVEGSIGTFYVITGFPVTPPSSTPQISVTATQLTNCPT